MWLIDPELLTDDELLAQQTLSRIRRSHERWANLTVEVRRRKLPTNQTLDAAGFDRDDIGHPALS
ncbi:MAG: hypothetical protein ACRYFW_14435 [Janthinobacterium lividum]